MQVVEHVSDKSKPINIFGKKFVAKCSLENVT